MLERCEERRDRLAHLEVDGAMLDLDHDIRLEGSVECVEVVVAGASAIGLEVVPVEVIVVDEAAVENNSAMRFEGACDCVRGLWGVRPYLEGPTRPSESALITKPPKSGINL